MSEEGEVPERLLGSVSQASLLLRFRGILILGLGLGGFGDLGV